MDISELHNSSAIQSLKQENNMFIKDLKKEEKKYYSRCQLESFYYNFKTA